MVCASGSFLVVYFLWFSVGGFVLVVCVGGSKLVVHCWWLVFMVGVGGWWSVCLWRGAVQTENLDEINADAR